MLADWREIPSDALLREETRRFVREAIAGFGCGIGEIISCGRKRVNIAETAEILGISIGTRRCDWCGHGCSCGIVCERTNRKGKAQFAERSDA